MSDTLSDRLREVVRPVFPPGPGPVALLLVPIVVLAAALRFVNLSARGLIYWDEGKFALEGVRLLSIMQTLPAVHAGSLAGKAIGTAKPTHALLIALSYAVFGVHDYAPLYLDAAASVGAVVIVVVWGRRLFGAWTGLIAGAFLAVSGYDLVYARSALSESDANLLFLLGGMLWWRARTGEHDPDPRAGGGQFELLAAGLLLGLAFTTNYRVIVYIATLVGIDLLRNGTGSSWRQAARSAIPLLVGLALAPLLWQIVGLLAAQHRVVLFRSEITYRPVSYWNEVLYQLHGGRQSVLRFSPLPYLEWYVVRQGWPLVLLLAAGLIAAARERSRELIIPAALLLVPFLVYSFAPFIVPRNLDATVPFASLLSAAGLTRLPAALPHRYPRRLPLILGTLLVVILAGLQVWPLTTVRSGFAVAATYVARHRSPGAFVVNEVMEFYLRDPGRGCDAPRLPRGYDSLLSDARNGNKYAVVDQYTSPLAAYLARHAQRVAHVPTLGSISLGDDLIASENGVPPLASHAEYVDVYALTSLHLALHDFRLAKQSCTLDRLA